MTDRLTGSAALAAMPRDLMPVVKSLFFGLIPEDTVFPFPEVDAAQRDVVSAFLDSFRAFAKEHVDSRRFEREHRIPPEVIRGLGELGAFGMTIPEEFGGYGFTAAVPVLSNTVFIYVVRSNAMLIA